VRSDAPVDFALKADLFLGAFPWLREQINTTAAWVDGQAGTVATHAASAANDAGTASAAGAAATTAAATASAAATSATNSATAAGTAKTAAEAAATRAEDAAQYVEGVVGPLGTAATRNVTTSATDTTAGRVMKVGDFGLGTLQLGSTNLIDNLNDLSLATGVYGYSANAVGAPTAGEPGALLVMRFGNSAMRQVAWPMNGIATVNSEFIRQVRSGPIYDQWVSVHHSGNQLGLGITAKSARDAVRAWEAEERLSVIQSATGTVDIDMSQSSTFSITLAGNTTLNPTNIPVLSPDETRSIVVSVNQGATAYTLSWWGSIIWLKSTPLTLPAANKIREYVLTYGGVGFWVGREGAGT
jgi:hypothetical protein